MALYYNGNKIIGSDGTCSADKVSLDDTNLSYEADDVQEAFEKVTKSLTYDEYEALTEVEKNNGTIYLITDVNGDGQSFQPVIYSEEEREIGVWVDGRPVYEKTLNVGTIGSSTTFAHGISNLDWIVDYSLFGLYGGSDKRIFPSHGSNSSIGFVISTWDSTNIVFIKGNLSSDFSGCYCTIRYTKSTDQAGSGQWTPQGVPAVHYSEDEQVIGTWVDGSTIYEKTVNIAQYSVTAVDTDWNNLFAIPNIEYLVSAEAHGNSPNIGQNLRFYANNGYIQIASKTSIDVSILGTYYFTFRYTKSST